MAENLEGFVYVPEKRIYVALHPLSFEKVSESEKACVFLESKGYVTKDRTDYIIMESKSDLEELLKILGSRMLTAEEAPDVLEYAKTNSQDLYKDMTFDKEKEGLIGEVIKSGNEYLGVIEGDWSDLYPLSPYGESHASPVGCLLNCLGVREVKSEKDSCSQLSAD